eukprot:3332494-Rhodomonas_salina.1
MAFQSWKGGGRILERRRQNLRSFKVQVPAASPPGDSVRDQRGRRRRPQWPRRCRERAREGWTGDTDSEG